MNLAWDGRRLLVAGHWILAESQGLKRFRHLKPRGLPALDLHAYAVDPKRLQVHDTLEATHGYFQSQDGGKPGANSLQKACQKRAWPSSWWTTGGSSLLP